MPFNAMGIWEDDDYASGGMLPGSGGSFDGSGVTLQPAAPSFNGWSPTQQTNNNQSFSNYIASNPSVASQAPSDFWIPPGASYGDNPSGRINQQNPFADPGGKYVQGGESGGFLDGIGPTLGEGSSLTKSQADTYWNQAMSADVPQDWALDFLKRNTSATGVPDVNRILEAYRSENQGDRDRGFPRDPLGGGSSDPRQALSGGGGSGQTWSGNWFTDPATQQLEDVIKNQLNQLTNPGANDPQSQLMAFLMKRFQELAGSNGYSPEELALLRTQGSEPIEALRTASQNRELERTARAGYLPTSGLTRINQQQNDVDYDRMRTAAQRDLAVQNINERTNRLNQAAQLGQTALATQRGTNANQLQLSTLLQQLPVQALNQALAVLNGTTNPSQLGQLVAQYTQLQQQNQYQQNAQQAALWNNIGAILAGL